MPNALGHARASWEFLLEPLDHDRTRLIARGRVSPHWLDGPEDRSLSRNRTIFIERVYRVLTRIPKPVLLLVAGLGHCIMQARQLRGIKRRAEA